MDKILIVEDDKHISKLIEYNLKKANYACLTTGSGEEVIKILTENPVSLIILDINLPGMDGYQVCKNIKQRNKFTNIPILMLTARGDEIDRITGLELGADDYVVKPFSPTELLLRIKAILKRTQLHNNEKDILEIKNIKINFPEHTVKVDDRAIDLTPMEFKLLATLMERTGRVQTRTGLLSDVWDMNSEVLTRTVDTHIKRLREKLGKCGKYIETVSGVGYKFIDD